MAEEDGTIQERLISMYEGLAAGGVGLIITGHMYVLKDWPCHPHQTGIWGDNQLEGLRRMAEYPDVTARVRLYRSIALVANPTR